MDITWTHADTPPAEEGRYLVTRYDKASETEFVDILFYEDGEWWNGMFHDDFGVIAYMPLPYAYKIRTYYLTRVK